VTEKASNLWYTRGLETVNPVQFGNNSEEKKKVTFLEFLAKNLITFNEAQNKTFF
jgi:hypothetical protein